MNSLTQAQSQLIAAAAVPAIDRYTLEDPGRGLIAMPGRVFLAF